MTKPEDERIVQITHVREAETLRTCPWCKGNGLISFEQYAEWSAKYPEVRTPPDPEAA